MSYTASKATLKIYLLKISATPVTGEKSRMLVFRKILDL